MGLTGGSRRLHFASWTLICYVIAFSQLSDASLPFKASVSAPRSLIASAAPSPTASTPTVTASATTVEGSESSSNMVVQLATYLKNSVTRTVQGCGELWTNYGRCKDIRTKVQAHRTKIREHWEEQGLFNDHPQYKPRDLKQQLEKITGGISFEEYAFLQKGKDDRGRVLNLAFLVFGAPRFLPYALMFNPEMLPSPLQANGPFNSENIFEKKARERSAEIIETLLKLEKSAREVPALAKLNIFGRKKQEQKKQNNLVFNQHLATFMSQHLGPQTSTSHLAGAKQLLKQLNPYLISSDEDFSRQEKRLCSVPANIVQCLVNSLTGKGPLSGFSPHAFARGRLLGHLKRVEEADSFLTNCQVDISTISPRLLREACSDRMIGGPAYSIPELQQSLGDWLQLVEPPTDAALPPASSQGDAPQKSVQSPPVTIDGVPLPKPQPVVSSDSSPSVYYNSNVARVALLSYFGMQGTRYARNQQSILPRLLFSDASPFSMDSQSTNAQQQSKNGKQGLFGRK